MVVTFGWMLCPECGDIEYIEPEPELIGVSYAIEGCLYFLCEEGK